MHITLSWITVVCVTIAGESILSAQTPKDIPHEEAYSCGCISGSEIAPHYKDATVTPFPKTGFYGEVYWSHIASNDLPLDHRTHDFNFYMKVETTWKDSTGTLRSYMSDGNFFTNRAAWYLAERQLYQRVLEVEWESKYIPERFWGIAGDHVWIKGRYMWDCGHEDKDKIVFVPEHMDEAGVLVPGHSEHGYHNEVHPPKAVAFTRFEPCDLSGAGIFSTASSTTLYVCGEGGAYSAPVANELYTFTVPMPTRPAPSAKPLYRVINYYDGPEPTLRYVPGDNRLEINYDLRLGDTDPARRFGLKVCAGWDVAEPQSEFKRYRVHFDELTMLNNHDRLCSGNWMLWIRVNSSWFKVPGLNAVDSGEVVKINRDLEVVVAKGGAITVQTTGWKNNIDYLFNWFFTPTDLLNTIEDLNTGGVEQNHSIGIVYKTYNVGQNFQSFPNENETSKANIEIDGSGGTSRADDLFGTEETAGDFSLTYSITPL